MNLIDTEVEVIFYSESTNDGPPLKWWKWWVWWKSMPRIYQFVTRQRIAHCALRFTQGDKKYLVIIHQRGGMYFVPESRYRWLMDREGIEVGETVVHLGTAPISLAQLSCFIDRPDFKVAPFPVNVFWWFFGRHISKTYQPMTCSLVVCIILRFCGFNVNLHITPHQLYKEILNGTNNYLRTS